ncbi:MAG: GIY-YIG nuclease family protein [Cyclobacteriaceae bacterium]|jgi:putative endonuclease
MSCWTYVIYSPSIDRFYIGSTKETPEDRLMAHNNRVFGGKSFTSRAKDWELFLVIEGNNIHICRRIEQHLKKMKSRKYLCRLRDSPEKVEVLKEMLARPEH